MAKLYPPSTCQNAFSLPVSDLHTLHVEEYGNPKGLPVVFVHGGPGGGIDERYHRYFDLTKWRVVLFDQRGCGRSTPFGEIKENTTFDLVADMEKIRAHLRIEHWHVFGGSWGSTLSLAYAIKHAERVRSLMLRGIFLVRKSEINWFYQDGAGRFFPDEWERYLAQIPEAERGDMVKAYHKRLTSPDREVVLQAARAWSRWEGATSKLLQDKNSIEKFQSDQFAYAFARIENHYFINHAFFESDSYLLDNIHKIAHIPGVIVQGRYDMPCPPVSAYELHKKWPKSELIMIENAGHALSEEGITEALVDATNRFLGM